ncbi:subtilisin-like protein [Anaeromyces robustus]|uniref:Subtilisin-like protein n=1 Tax=Anaeromyces robustus TaxID=1754192 RepID=A0A1Y1WTZ9_9FUNG|nr:subtilisin-like protein [Anaeromyces robustus]|eukprot:ORX76932.1 subtilisin-like protein [Anaeromyces robustus]
MQNFILIKFSFIWSIILILFIHSINTKNIKYSKQNKKEKESFTDNYYAIFINNTLSTSLPKTTKNNYNKREEIQKEFVNSLINEIHSLIVENVNTYDNPNKIEEMIEKDKLRKRENHQIDSNIAFHLSSINNRSVIGAYLSNDLINIIKNYQGVYDVLPNRHFEYASHSNSNSNFNYNFNFNSNSKSNSYYNKNEIIKETKWKNLAIKSNTDNHLSIISQGKYNESIIEVYDNNYYYPSSGGENIDIFIFDSSFAFDYYEFTNNENRITKCISILSTNEINPPQSEKRCHSMFSKEHGSIVADIAAGDKHGVAPNANVYGFVLEDEATFFSVIKELEILKNDHGSLFRKNKAVINFSFGSFFKENEYTSEIEYLYDLIQQLNDKGAIFVVCAQNNSQPINNKKEKEILYPCYFDNVICVGATDNLTYDSYYNNEIIDKHPYQLTDYSNYGEGVNIYAPGFVTYEIMTQYYGLKNDTISGTSFATPIVTGVIATIMSENPNQNYNYKTMLTYLQEISLKNIVEGVEKNHSSNYFINNGKHVVYSKNKKYHGCGINAGNQKCQKNQCCTLDGLCSKNKKLCLN